MKVILLTDVPKVGNRYDVKDLKEGYAQNVLIARGLACLATEKELAKIEQRKKESEKRKLEEIRSFEELINAVNDKKIIIKTKTNEKGNLFKSINNHDVRDAIKKETGLEIEDKFIVMDHIKTVGLHKVLIKMGDKKGECTLEVQSI